MDSVGSIQSALSSPIFDFALAATSLTICGSRASAGEAPLDSDGASCSGRFGGDGGRRGSSWQTCCSLPLQLRMPERGAATPV